MNQNHQWHHPVSKYLKEWAHWLDLRNVHINSTHSSFQNFTGSGEQHPEWCESCKRRPLLFFKSFSLDRKKDCARPLPITNQSSRIYLRIKNFLNVEMCLLVKSKVLLQRMTNLFWQEQLSCTIFQEVFWGALIFRWLQSNKQSSAGKPKNVNSAVLEYVYCSFSPVVWILVWSLAWICYIPYHMWRPHSAQVCCVKPFVWPGCLSVSVRCSVHFCAWAIGPRF